MPGRIKADVVAAVKERTSIEDVVREHVTLRTGGVGSLKGLCPFHDEKSPSFNVRPQLGVWHCFGCGEGGDVLSFVQKVDHLTFTEAVERLAERAGVPVEYEEGGGPRPREEVGRRTRLVEANRTAEEFYAEQLASGSEALPGRTFLAERGFDREAAARFAVGYAPRSGEALLRHLRGRGFTDDEIVLAGLAGRGSRGPYDRFRGRLIWPIRDITGDCVGSAPAACTTTTGSRRSTSTPPTRRCSRSRRCSTGSTWPRRPSRPRAGPSWSRATPTSWPATWPASAPRSRRAARRSAPTTSRSCGASCATTTRSTPPRWCSPSTATQRGRRPRCARSARTSASSRRPTWRSSRTGSTRASCASSTVTRRCAS